MKRTFLYDEHLKLNAKMVDFCGWEMPIQYPDGIVAEHKAVRENCGLFDVSHMGEVFAEGEEAVFFLQHLVPQDISKLYEGHAVYCQMTDEQGGIIDDLIIYRLEEEKFLLIINAACIDNDFAWIEKNAQGYDVRVENKSEEYSMIALQGPKSSDVVEKSGIFKHMQPKFFSIIKTKIDGCDVFLSRTGYTGEDGFEILAKNEDISHLWKYLMEIGKEFSITPVGLGARDTLRLEAALLLYGQDMNKQTTPIEASLGWSVPDGKTADYNGRDVILSQLKNGVARKLVGLVMTDRAIPRHNCLIYKNGIRVGIVTSGSISPMLGVGIALGYVDTSKGLKTDDIVEIEIRGRFFKAKISRRPFVHKFYSK